MFGIYILICIFYFIFVGNRKVHKNRARNRVQACVSDNEKQTKDQIKMHKLSKNDESLQKRNK